MFDIFRSDSVVVRSIPTADASRWVITFDNYGIGHGFDRPGFGEEFFRNVGVSAIHVMGVREDWYQYPEMFAAMKAVATTVVGAERVMTYGSSMGGYAALRFADAAGANAALAISPQYSIDPIKVPFEKRWRYDSRRIRWLPEIDDRLTARTPPVVVFDPMGPDARHIALIEAEIDIEPIALPYVSHPATTFLGEVDLLKSLVLQTLSGEIDAGAFRRQARAEKGRSGLYIANLATAQPERRRPLALSLARLAFERSPHNTLAAHALAKILSQAGNHQEAIDLMDNILRATQRDPAYLIHHANVLLAASRHQEAVATAHEAVEALPHLARLHAWKGSVLWRAGDAPAAIASTRRAIEIDPGVSHYRDQAHVYRVESGLKQILGPLFPALGLAAMRAYRGLLSRVTKWRRRLPG